MSYNLFAVDVLSSIVPQHTSTNKQSRIVAQAYTRLVQRHFEVMTGGGRAITAPSRIPVLQAGLQAVFSANRRWGNVPLNIFSQMAPAFRAYWTGQIITGPLGNVTITFPGVFRGPALKTVVSLESWLNVFCAVAAAHIMTLLGVYIPNILPVPMPWSGVMMLACPILF
jgi:hypothetical protein